MIKEVLRGVQSADLVDDPVPPVPHQRGAALTVAAIQVSGLLRPQVAWRPALPPPRRPRRPCARRLRR
ncbi:hypothetical protein OG470_24230 [Micromonospora sp. NBC_00389]|uniref:hypothetical protein n=1 Tax=Micromonospora sp. NBC_00389 TaxID=2903586 RepID=UPI002E1CB09B